MLSLLLWDIFTLANISCSARFHEDSIILWWQSSIMNYSAYINTEICSLKFNGDSNDNTVRYIIPPFNQQ